MGSNKDEQARSERRDEQFLGTLKTFWKFLTRDGYTLKRLSVRMPVDDFDDYMVIIAVEHDNGGRFVAFVSGETLHMALSRAVIRWVNKQLRWSDDKYAKED